MTSSPSTLPPRRRKLALGDYALLGETLATLAMASLAIKFVPFRKLTEAVSRPPRRQRSPAVDLRRLRWAVGAWRRRVPWKAVCFQSALCLQAMLRRRGVPSVMHYGIAKEEDEALKAHVWLSVDGEIVIGGEEAPRFACVATFPSSGSPAQ
jgi:hypothetical protein